LADLRACLRLRLPGQASSSRPGRWRASLAASGRDGCSRFS
jgi:hypothetical protein